MNRFLTVAAVLVIFAAGLTGADEQAYEPLLERALVREGWTEEQAGALTRELHQHRLELQWTADPEIVAFALGATLRRQEALSTREMTQLALGLMETGGELCAMGYDDRTVALAAAEGVREMIQDRDRQRLTEAENDLAERVRLELRLRVTGEEQLRLKQQTRTGTGPASEPGGQGPGGGGGGPGQGPGQPGGPGSGGGPGGGPGGQGSGKAQGSGAGGSSG